MKIQNNDLRIIDNNWIGLFKTSLFLFWIVLIIAFLKEGFEVPHDKYDKRAFYFTIYFLVPIFTSSAIYYLNILIKSIFLDESKIVLSQSRVLFFKKLELPTHDILGIEIKNGNSSTIFFKFKNNIIKKVETLGLKKFEGSWIEPPYNQFMPSSPYGKNAHKIAYNISKKYNIPFESEFINQPSP